MKSNKKTKFLAQTDWSVPGCITDSTLHQNVQKIVSNTKGSKNKNGKVFMAHMHNICTVLRPVTWLVPKVTQMSKCLKC